MRSAGSRRIRTSQSTVSPSPPRCRHRRIAYQQHRPKVDLGRQAAVEPRLPFAVQAPRLDGAEVEIGIAHRLLQLVGMGIGEKNPGHGGLHRVHPRGRLRIGIRLSEESELGLEGSNLVRPG